MEAASLAEMSRIGLPVPQDLHKLKLGICGEHASIHFFEKAGLDYVSCSPYRVPIARLAAAQAALTEK